MKIKIDECTCVLTDQENLLLSCHDAKEKDICEDNFFFIFGKEVVVTLASPSVDEVLIKTHATCMSRYGARWPLSPARRGAGAGCRRIYDALLHRLAFDFFKFALFQSAFRSCFEVPRLPFANCDAKPDKLLPVDVYIHRLQESRSHTTVNRSTEFEVTTSL